MEWNIRMHTVLYCSPKGVVYKTRAYSKADIDQLVATHGLRCLTSADRQYDFWFAASPPKCQRRANTIATELLMATTTFTARTVPLLRGCVVIATHDSDGDLDGLSWQQLDELAAKNRAITSRQARILARRVARDARRRRPRPARRSAPPVAAQAQQPMDAAGSR
ncbi:hypothetical protein MMOR_49090 [Mycolicibacterium moriokaense]|uniref:Uncharacterized protein n=2 Tax=Mycolicibacterium moriokaense TaxID=39691 RepID=A0AAD1HEI0_9MYCO|nr:hypothetical protein MMOR_49090 [Mycolicibacterium moriokaense]